MELTRQQHDRKQRQHSHRAERGELRRTRYDRRGVRMVERLAQQGRGAREDNKSHKNSNAQEGDELHHRLGGDRQHQAILMFGGIDVPRAEQNGESRHRQCDKECEVAKQRRRRGAWRGLRQDRGNGR